MTESEIKQEAQSIFNSLTEAQKEHIYRIYADEQYSKRNKELKDTADRLFSERFTILMFLTAGHSTEVYSAFEDMLIIYLHKRYRQEDKCVDDLLCEDPQ